MKLIFVRHGDPDYSIDNLTEKGKREVALLTKRLNKWEGITDIYCSPLGRAKATCEQYLKENNLTAKTYDWLREFAFRLNSEDAVNPGVPWDFYPEYWRNQEKLYDKDEWLDAKIYENSEIHSRYKETSEGIDKLLAEHGIERKGNVYVNVKGEKNEDVLVFFCHLGVEMVILGHILGISPSLLWHTFFVAPTSVTIVGCEERVNNVCNFRIQTMGDASHLYTNGEPVSKSGYFTDTFQG